MEKIRLCPHRGFSLGKGKPCKYHGLTFPKNKECFEKQKQELFRLFDDSIFERFEEDMGTMFHKNEMDVSCPYYLWIQNTMDPNHLVSVHEDFSKLFQNTAPYDVSFCRERLTSSYEIGIPDNVIRSYRRICGDGISDNFQHILVFPNISITSFLNVFYSIEAAEERGNGCRITTRFYDSKKNPVPQELISQAITGNLKILKEDKLVCEEWAKTYHLHKQRNWLPGEDRIRVYQEQLNRGKNGGVRP